MQFNVVKVSYPLINRGEAMLDDYYAQYRDYLREGMRIEVGIPLSGGGVFRDWAIISEAVGDELLVQISRDVLPANVRVDIGFILDVSVWIRKEVYTCSGIITDKLGVRILRIRLFGKFTLQERRQFFRINLDLRLKYAFVQDATAADVESDWAQRRDLEQMKYQGFDAFVIDAQRARYQPVVKLEWHEVSGAEVNLGGGGILLTLPEPVEPEELLALELIVPLTPPRHVHTVARVIHVMVPRAQRGTSRYRVGMQFVFLDERDRDLLFRHISVTQIELLRRAANLRELPEAMERSSTGPDWRRLAGRALLAVSVLIVVFLLVRYLIRYSEQGSPNEIQQTYEKAIKHYRHEE